MCFDSSSSSQANPTTTTNTYDQRIAGGNDSALVSNSGAGAVVTVTDAGAVHQSFGFASQALAGALQTISANDKATQQAASDAVTAVQSAWSDAKQGEQKILVGMGMIVVAVVAVQALKKG